MKHLKNLSDFALHREGRRVRELIQINREKADLAFQIDRFCQCSHVGLCFFSNKIFRPKSCKDFGLFHF